MEKPRWFLKKRDGEIWCGKWIAKIGFFEYNHKEDHYSNFEDGVSVVIKGRKAVGLKLLTGEEQLDKFQRMYGYFDED